MDRVRERSSACPWSVALAGAASLALAMGIGRFGFTPLLPLMLHEGSVTLKQGAALATSNYVGYLAGAVLCLAIRLNAVTIVRFALVFTVILTLAMAQPDNFTAWLVWRAGAGVCSAMVMVYATAWCMQRLAELGRPTLGALLLCGPGLGIVVTGCSAYSMVAWNWPSAWGWIAFGLLGALLLAAVWRIYGSPSAAMDAGRPNHAPPAANTHTLDRETVALTAAYGLAGFGYIITATFLPVIARQAMPGSVWSDLFWPILGVAATVGAWGVSRIEMHRDNRPILVLLYVMQAVGVGLVIVWPTITGFVLSSLLAGPPFTAVVSVAMREARRLRPVGAARLIGCMTVAYASGQIAGPPVTAALVARTGGFHAPLAVAVAALLIGAAIYLGLQRMFPLTDRSERTPRAHAADSEASS